MDLPPTSPFCQPGWTDLTDLVTSLFIYLYLVLLFIYIYDFVVFMHCIIAECWER